MSGQFPEMFDPSQHEGSNYNLRRSASIWRRLLKRICRSPSPRMVTALA
jgi:hypothetical protein